MMQRCRTDVNNAVQHARKNIYGAGMKKWGSYAVRSPTDIKHSASHPMGGHRTSRRYIVDMFLNSLAPARANDADTRTRAIFVLAAKKAPYCVYGNPFYDHAGFIDVFSVDQAAALHKNIQSAPLEERSAIHGMVFDPAEEYLYSADMWANKIWCHKKVATSSPSTVSA